jgi:proteasome lid subunit RPN8/RPN11
MPGLGIRIAPPTFMQPCANVKPLENSRRWASPYDGDGIQPAVSVFLNHAAYIRVSIHSCSSDTVEVGGVLVGDWCVDEETAEEFVIVKHALPARHTLQGSVYLTFTHDSLVDLHDQIEKRFEGERIVGWYHTHPRMGIFLSHYDTWLHKYFFPEPWQIALVVEPHASLGGFFIRQQDGDLDPTRYFGFYEVDGGNGCSIVRWQNLKHNGDGSKGGSSNE